MDLKIKVKVGEINNLSDARYCAGMGVEMIGFSLDETNMKYLSPSRIAEISNWLTGVKIVGEFESVPILQVRELMKIFPFDFVQLNINSVTPDLLKELSVPVILQVQVSDITTLAEELKEFEPLVSYFLLEGEEDLNKEEATWKALCERFKILLGLGVNKENIDYILHRIKPTGIALKGGVEIRPGLKDFDDLSEILELLEPDEYNL